MATHAAKHSSRSRPRLSSRGDDADARDSSVRVCGDEMLRDGGDNGAGIERRLGGVV